MDIQQYDIFLSHSFSDREEVQQAKVELEQCGYTVFVDWDEAPKPDRSAVTEKTVVWLRKNMRRCASLFFATSKHSPHSKWMPWELGYMDAFRGRVFVFPLDDDVAQGDTGQEYLDIYPVIDRANLSESLNRCKVKKCDNVGLFSPADPPTTIAYREWFRDNMLRLCFDPYWAMKTSWDIWHAYFRLWFFDSMDDEGQHD